MNAIIDGLKTRRIQIVIGPRRVGKSILMQQTIGHLLRTGTEPKRILFLSCDDPTLFDGKASIGDVIEGYLTEILHETASELTKRVYVFIDEIHAHTDWQLWLKHYYEPQYNIKFICSGSSASHLFDASKESLMGRTDTMRLMPLGFMQFCRFWSTYKNDGKVTEFLELIPDGSPYIDADAYYSDLMRHSCLWDHFKPYVNAVLHRFLLMGGYPEFFMDGSEALWQKRLVDDIIGQGLYRDIVSIYRIKAPDKLEKLLYCIADNNGQEFNVKTIADTIGCDNETVGNYLFYLSQAYMTIILGNYSPNMGKTLRKNKTLYVLDNGIANALLRLQELDDTRTGHIVESVCARDALAICEDNRWTLHYWRDRGVEVDLVIDKKIGILPIEVKYRANARHTSLAAFNQAFPNFKIPVSVVITKDCLGREGDIFYFPFWLAR